MKIRNKIFPIHKVLSGVVFLAILCSAFQAQPAGARNLEICIFPGTAQLKQAEIQSLKTALRRAGTEIDFNGAECFAPIDLRDEGEWMFVTLA